MLDAFIVGRTIGRILLNESDDFDNILRVIFDCKMTFEKHLRSVYRAASQRLGILRKSCRVFHDRLLLGRIVRGCVLPVLKNSFKSSTPNCTCVQILHRLFNHTQYHVYLHVRIITWSSSYYCVISH